MNPKKIEIFVIVAAIAVVGIIFALTQKSAVAPTIDQNSQSEQTQATTIQYQGVDGKTALELLKASHTIEVQESSFGSFVTAIDGLAPDNKTQFWAFYVNGEQAQVGASSYVTKNGDVIEWKVEEIKY